MTENRPGGVVAGETLGDKAPIQLPDYTRGSIVNLMGSLLGAFGGPDLDYAPLRELPPEEIRQYRQVVLMVVDGLGDDLLARIGPDSNLLRHRRCRLTSVFPSTTASAITSFLTGTAPRQHGVTGWHMYLRELGAVLAILPGRPRYGGISLSKAGVDVVSLLGHRPLFDLLRVSSVVVTPRPIARSDYNRSHLGRARLADFGDMNEFFRKITQALQGNRRRRFVYAYWSELDHIAHEAGSVSAETERHLNDWDRAFGCFLDEAAGTDTLVLVTADHGFIDIDEDRVIHLSEHPEWEDCLSLPLCGEPRAAYAYVRPQRVRAFEAYVSGHLGEYLHLYRSEDLIQQGWFGAGSTHPRLADRIGDYTLVMKEGYVVRDRLPSEKPFQQRGVHGGVSAAEMWVPLSVIGV